MSNHEHLNIVILGASFAGLAVAHNFLRKTIDEVGVTRSAPRYRVVLVGPSTHLYWNIGAPRALVSEKLLPMKDVFVPFLNLFDEYSETKFEFVQGLAVGVDFESRFVSVEIAGGKPTSLGSPVNSCESGEPDAEVEKQHEAGAFTNSQQIPFHALVIATGTSAISPLLSLHGNHEKTMEDLTKFHANLEQATSIIIAGGGPSGIECAGQLATFLNRGKKPRPPPKSDASPARPTIPVEKKWAPPQTAMSRLLSPSSKSKHNRPSTSSSPPCSSSRRTIMLISGHDRLLPRLLPIFGAQAEAKLKKLGVNVIHNMRVSRSTLLSTGSTRCTLSSTSNPTNHEKLMYCDAFISATGVRPNTSFLPPSLLDASGYINCDPHFLRVPLAGDRIYALGDCASHTKNSIQDVYDSVPTLLHNLKQDLLSHELHLQYPHGGAEPRLEALEDWAWMQNQTDSQLMPISRFGGVGVLFGMQVPSLLVWLMKGRDYRIGRAKLAAGVGKDPYAVV